MPPKAEDQSLVAAVDASKVEQTESEAANANAETPAATTTETA